MQLRSFWTAALLLSATFAANAQSPAPTNPDEIAGRLAAFHKHVDHLAGAELEDTLIYCLRYDNVEPIRFDSAELLAKRQYCSTKTLAALYLTATGNTMDRGLCETSDRVKLAAKHALELCVFHRVNDHGRAPLATNSSSTIRLAAFYTDEMLHQSEAQLFDQIYLFLAETASMPGPRAARETSANTVAPGQTPSRPGGLLGPLGRGGGFMLWPSLPAPPSAGFGMPW